MVHPGLSGVCHPCAARQLYRLRHTDLLAFRYNADRLVDELLRLIQVLRHVICVGGRKELARIGDLHGRRKPLLEHLPRELVFLVTECQLPVKQLEIRQQLEVNTFFLECGLEDPARHLRAIQQDVGVREELARQREFIRVVAFLPEERLEVVDEFPRTLAGKVKKYQLRGSLRG